MRNKNTDLQGAINENLPRVSSSRDLMKFKVFCDDPIIERKMFSPHVLMCSVATN